MRSATAEQHELLDGSLAIGRADASLADYRAHLCMLRAWLAPLQTWLAGFTDGPQAAMEVTDRIAVIDADLRDPAMPSAGCAETDPVPWPRHASAAYRWGVCYVVEGSQLGGAVLYQRLAASLAPHPLRYLQGQTQGPGPRWRQFMLALRQQVRSADEIAQACQGARDAFDRILQLRCNCGR